MTAKRSHSGSFKIVATLGMVLLMAFFSACEVLATQGARDAIANGREIREFENEELAPLKQQMTDLWENEIQPRETQVQDLHFELQRLEEDLLRPLRDAQNDVWGPGGEASEAQLVFEERYRVLELAQRDIEIEQRELDIAWQTVWNGSTVDPEYQALEDLRYEKQRELDHLYRFGYRPIDDIWDEINELNATQGSVSPDVQEEVDRINRELQRLWDLISVMQYDGDDESNRLNDQAQAAQDQLNDLYNNGWVPINEIYFEIERLEAELASSSSSDVDSINAQIVELESLKASYVTSRDAEVAVLKEQLAAIEADSTSTGPADSTARIAELEQLVADLYVKSAGLVASKNAEIDALTVQIVEKKTSYDQLIADATTDFQAVSVIRLADAAAIGVQIADLTAVGGDDAAVLIAILQPQYDVLIAQEQAEETALGVSVAQFESDRDAGVAELQVSIDSIQALIADGLTTTIDAQIAEYNAELKILRASSEGTVVTVSNTESEADILENIEATRSYWNGLIDEVVNKIQILETELLAGSPNDGIETRIHSLRLQATELENSMNAEIARLEAVVNELNRQANDGDYGTSGQMAEIQAQIDALNAELEAIRQNGSTGGVDVRQRVQELERQARVLEEELEQNTRRLEEELWDLDEQLSLFHNDQETVNRARQAEFEALSVALQQRRFELEEQRWAIDEEQRAVFDAIEASQAEAVAAIRVIEDEQISVLRDQIRVLEVELRGFHDQQRVIESAMRDAEALVDEKKRELENKVLEALEDAAGVAGGTVEAGETAEAQSSTSDDEVPATVVVVE